MTKNTNFKVKGLKDDFTQNLGPKTHFPKLRDQNMIFSKVKGPKTYFSQAL